MNFDCYGVALPSELNRITYEIEQYLFIAFLVTDDGWGDVGTNIEIKSDTLLSSLKLHYSYHIRNRSSDIKLKQVKFESIILETR